MKGMKRKIILAFAIMTGTVIGTFCGASAKHRFISKMKDRPEEHNKIQQEEVMLDEYELSAFHTS